MEVHFHYTREDWVEVDARFYRRWFWAQKPLVGSEYVICWFLFVVSLAGGAGLVGLLGYAAWVGLAWYFVVGAAALLVVGIGMFLEVVKPRREPVRGMFHELVVRMNLQDQQFAKVKERQADNFRRQEEQGTLVLTHRYHLRLEPEGVVLTTEYPSVPGPAARQDVRWGWDAVSAISQDDHLLSFALSNGQFIFIPRTAFPDEDACGRFLRAAEAYRTAPPPPDSRIQTQTAVSPQVGAFQL
jgi:hypothetical protein